MTAPNASFVTPEQATRAKPTGKQPRQQPRLSGERSQTARPQGQPAKSPHSRQDTILGLQRTVGNRAVGQLLGSGRPLEPRLQAEMEERFLQDFSSVRIHTGAQADDSAKSVKAKAYTVGNDIVFRNGGFTPDSGDGKHLLAHELAHVVQQKDAVKAGPFTVDHPHSPAENEARSAAHQVAAGGTVASLSPRGSQAVQREADADTGGTDSLGKTQDFLLEGLVGAAVGEGFSKDLLVAAMKGFIVEIGVQIESRKNDKAVVEHLNEFKTLKGAAKAYGGFLGGSAAGLISPLTGLFELAVFGEQMSALATKMAGSLFSGSSTISEKARELKNDIVAFGKKAKDEIKKLGAKVLLDAISAVQTKGGNFLKKANEVGHSTAKDLAKSFDESLADKKSESAKEILTERKEGESYSQPLGLANSIIDRTKDQVFSSFPARVGYAIGYGVGAAAINIILFVFTDGIGNLITKIGSWLGKIAPALARVAEALEFIGSALTAVENGIAAVAKVILKPLEPLMRELEPILIKLRAFLNDLFGVVKKEGASAAAGAAGKGLAGEAKNLEKPGALTPKTHPEPKVNTGNKQLPVTKPKTMVKPSGENSAPVSKGAEHPKAPPVKESITDTPTPVKPKETLNTEPKKTTTQANPKETPSTQSKSGVAEKGSEVNEADFGNVQKELNEHPEPDNPLTGKKLGPKAQNASEELAEPAAVKTKDPAAQEKEADLIKKMQEERIQKRLEKLKDTPDLQNYVKDSKATFGDGRTTLKDLADESPQNLKDLWSKWNEKSLAGNTKTSFDEYVKKRMGEFRGSAGEIGEAFGRGSDEILLKAPKGRVTESGTDLISYNTNSDRVKIIDNKAFKSNAKVSKVTATEKNLVENLEDDIADIRKYANDPTTPSAIKDKALPRLEKAHAELKVYLQNNPNIAPSSLEAQKEFAKILKANDIDRVVTTTGGGENVRISGKLRDKKGFIQE